LAAEGNEWVSLHRNRSIENEERGIAGIHNGTSEISVRGQFRAWLAAMTPDSGTP
jgi:benzoate/toluate 1,2-dioxygenase alpha subunit